MSAGKKVRLMSGDDMTIRGGVIAADRLAAKAGGDPKIEGLQDTRTSSTNQRSMSYSLRAVVDACSAKASG